MLRVPFNILIISVTAGFPALSAHGQLVLASVGAQDASLAATAPASAPPSQSPDEIYKSLAETGLAAGNLFKSAVESGNEEPAWDAGKVGPDISAIHDGYVRSRDMGRAGPKLIGADLGLALTAIDVGSEGASLIATAPARLIINWGVDKLAEASDKPVRQELASDIQKFLADTNRSPEDSSPLTADQKTQLDKIPSLMALKARFTDDPVATAIVQNGVDSLLYQTSSEELTTLAQQGAQVDDLQDQIEDNSKKATRAISTLQTDMNGKFDSLQTEIESVGKDVDSSQAAIADLRDETEDNSAQFSAVEGLMYSHSSAADKVAMLDAGYLPDNLGPGEVDKVETVLKAQASRDTLENDVKTAIAATQDLAKISTGLGLPPAVGEAFNDASAAEGVFGDVVEGNYLGAVAGLVGIFGHHGPSETQILQEQMNKQFDKVNAKLDKVLDGEAALGKAIAALSTQIGTFQMDTENHLYEIDARLQDVQKILVGIHSQGADDCQSIEDFVDLNGDFDADQIPDMRDPKNLDLVRGVLNYSKPLNDCATFLRKFGSVPTTLRKSLGPFVYNPMEYWVFADSDQTVGVPDGAANQGVIDYTNRAKSYHDEIYKPALEVYAQSIKAPLKAFGMAGGLTPSQAFELASIPVVDVPHLRKKLTSLSPGDAACVSDSYLSAPLAIMLCDKEPWNLGGKSDPTERKADDYASKLIQDPIYLDAVPNLSHWALFFYPIFDTYSNDQKILLNPEEALANHSLRPLGKQIVDPILNLDTLAIAQANILQGDMMAAFVFNAIWDDNNGLAGDAPPGPKDPKKPTPLEAAEAQFIPQFIPGNLKHRNDYLRKNVLMLAMDSARGPTQPGRDHAYDFALDYFQASDTEPEFLLSQLFNGKLRFGVRWAPKDATTNPPPNCDDSNPDRKRVCIKIPVAKILGESIDLPPLEAFSDRELVYPQSLMNILAMRDRLAEAAATYNAFEVAVQRLPEAQKEQRKTQLGLAHE